MIKKKVTYVNGYKRKANNEIISIKPYYRNVPNPAKSEAKKKWERAMKRIIGKGTYEENKRKTERILANRLPEWYDADEKRKKELIKKILNENSEKEMKK